MRRGTATVFIKALEQCLWYVPRRLFPDVPKTGLFCLFRVTGGDGSTIYLEIGSLVAGR